MPIADLGLSIVARGRDGFRPRSSRNVGFICKAPERQFIVRHSEVMPDGGRYIQAGPRTKGVARHNRLAEYKVEVILTARSDVLQLRKAGECVPSDLHPAVLQKRGNTGTVPGDT